METKRRFDIGGRIPGEMVLDALRDVLDSHHCKRRWEMSVTENHKVVFRCYCEKAGKESQFETNVQIMILETIDQNSMYRFISAELIFRTRNFFAKRRYSKDLEIMATEFKKRFDGYPWPYRAFDNQK